MSHTLSSGDSPLFTIIIATHDRPQLLQRTLESLIAQTYQNFKLVIVADSAAYIPPYRELQAFDRRFVYIIRSGVNGPAESRNMGLDVTAGSDYIVFLDDDDTFRPGHLQALADAIGSARPELLFCDFQVQNEDRTTYPPKALSNQSVSIADVTPASVYVRNRIPNSCVTYRSDVLATLRYDTDLILYEDWDFLLDALKGRSLRHVATDTVVIHKSQATAPENMRRGNSRDEKIVEVMLQLYQKHPAPDMETRLTRQALLAGAGVKLGLEHF
jgi:glycosyltransferase involved in cell wall biosynthesis